MVENLHRKKFLPARIGVGGCCLSVRLWPWLCRITFEPIELFWWNFGSLPNSSQVIFWHYFGHPRHHAFCEHMYVHAFCLHTFCIHMYIHAFCLHRYLCTCILSTYICIHTFEYIYTYPCPRILSSYILYTYVHTCYLLTHILYKYVPTCMHFVYKRAFCLHRYVCT
jgi:hypothetical protein